MCLNLRGTVGSFVVVVIFDVQRGRYIKLAYLTLGVGVVRRFGLG